MTSPTRLRDDPQTSSSVRELLQPGLASKRLPGDVRQRSERRLNRLIVVPAAAGVLFWIKGVAIASLCVVSTVAVVRTVAAVHQMTKAKTMGSAAQGAHFREPRAANGARVGLGQPPQFVSPTPSLVAITPPRDVVAQRDPTASPAAPPTPRPLATPARPPAKVGILAMAPKLAEPVTPEAPEAPHSLDSLAREVAMLEQARATLDSNPGGALAELDRYAERFPAGRLTIESGLLAVEALKRLGRIEEARSRGAALLEQARGSLYETRIRTLISE